MNARKHHVLVLALTTGLMTPAAMAQDTKGVGQAAVQEWTPRLPPPALPTRAADNTEAMLNTNAPPSLQQLNESEPPPPPEVEEAAMNAPKPPPANAQGADNAAAHSKVVQRDQWAQLDANGDGRISGTEGQVNADFKANFGMMDKDRDGFITDAEFRAHAKADHAKHQGTRDQDDRDD